MNESRSTMILMNPQNQGHVDNFKTAQLNVVWAFHNFRIFYF